MTTARIVHLSKNELDLRFPLVIAEIEGDIYVDLKSASIFTNPPQSKDFKPFWYALRKASKNTFKFYVLNNELLVPINHSLLCSYPHQPLYIQWYIECHEKLYKEKAVFGGNFGWSHIIEVLYNGLYDTESDEILSFNEILSLELKKLQVSEFHPPFDLEYQAYSIKENVTRLIFKIQSSIEVKIEKLKYWINGYVWDDEAYEYVKR